MTSQELLGQIVVIAGDVVVVSGAVAGISAAAAKLFAVIGNLFPKLGGAMSKASAACNKITAAGIALSVDLQKFASSVGSLTGKKPVTSATPSTAPTLPVVGQTKLTLILPPNPLAQPKTDKKDTP